MGDALTRLLGQWRGDHLGPEKDEGIGLLWKEGGFVELLVALHRVAPQTMRALAEELATAEPADTRMRDFLVAWSRPAAERDHALEAADLHAPTQSFGDALDALDPPMRGRFRERIGEWLDAARAAEANLHSEARALTITPKLRDDLVRLRSGLKLGGAPEIPVAAVSAIVEELRCTVPDEVLATLAALERPLEAMTGLLDELDEFYAANEQPNWKSRSSFDHVPFLAWGEWPRNYACFSRRDGSIDVFDIKTSSVSGSRQSISTMLRWAWPDVDFEGVVSADDFAPKLCAAPEPSAISHPKFGSGTVLEDLGDRARVRFEDGSERTMLWRFLRRSTRAPLA